MHVADISDWQEGLDFDELAQHFQGVIIKISEGCTPSQCWEQFIEEVEARGMQWGVYCYTCATTAERAKEEAQTVIDLLSTKNRPSLGIWIDVENPETLNCSNEVITAICSAFVNLCNEHNYTSGIYSFIWCLENQVNTDDLADYVPYWVADIVNGYNKFADDNPHLVVQGWQYSHHFNVGNVEVDANEWY